jgi:hypothetical protein
MQVIITYDLNTGHSEVKAHMKSKGYLSAWSYNDVNYYLPNTTLWKKDTELSTAKKDLEETKTYLNQTPQFQFLQIIIERCIVTSANPWDGIPGIPSRT